MSGEVFGEIPVLDVGALVDGAKAGDGGGMDGDGAHGRNGADGRSGEARQALVAELRRVCHEVGFLIVVNHGVDAGLRDDVFDMMRRLFSLSVEHKQRIDKRNSRHFRGWEPVGVEYTNNRPDTRELFDCWTEWPALDPDVEPKHLRLLGPNQWLPEHVLAGHQELSNEWSRQLGVLAGRLLGALWKGLGLGAEHLDRFVGQQPVSRTKFMHYPATPSGAAGVNAHHDTGFLTVLATDGTPGLQVQNPVGDWIEVPTVPGGLVVNLGEGLQAMTGNYLVATPHRVISSAERWSTGYFWGPSLETPLDRLPLDDRFAAAVAASPYHRDAGFMAANEETEAGVGDMASNFRPATYGEQLWNYLARSYPESIAHHYP